MQTNLVEKTTRESDANELLSRRIQAIYRNFDGGLGAFFAELERARQKRESQVEQEQEQLSLRLLQRIKAA